MKYTARCRRCVLYYLSRLHAPVERGPSLRRRDPRGSPAVAQRAEELGGATDAGRSSAWAGRVEPHPQLAVLAGAGLVGVLLASLSAHRRRLGDPPSGEPIPRALGLPVIPLAVAATPAGGAGLGALALMAVVTGRLGRAALVDVWTVLLTVVSA